MCSPRRYNPATLAAPGVDNGQLAVINDTEGDEAVFAIIPAGIGLF
jgi:hypothetical protein